MGVSPSGFSDTARLDELFDHTGKNDEIFPAEGAHPYKRDLKNLEFHLLDTGHFALEEDGKVIAGHIRRFIDKKVTSTQ